MPIHIKKVLFPNYNFSATEKVPPLWFLEYLIPSQQKICEEAFKQNNLTDDMEKRFLIIELLRQKKIHEDSYQYRRRIQKVKNMIA